MRNKNSIIEQLKPRFQSVVPHISIANAQNYRKARAGEVRDPGMAAMKITSALSGAVMSAFKMRKNNQRVNTNAPEFWLNTGRDLQQRLQTTSKGKTIELVCDTCSALAIHHLSELKNIGHAELFADTGIHHHFVVVNRDLNSNIQDSKTWGNDAFVIDIWQALFSGHEVTKRGMWDKAHHYKHGIYRHRWEHVYSRGQQGQNHKLKSDVLFQF